jgi:hypothetical protein
MPDELASLLHEHLCNMHTFGKCWRWTDECSAHRDYYQMRADNIRRELEPIIGIANVNQVTEKILKEVI